MESEEWINPQWIRERLEQTGRTQRDLAKELGIDSSQISRLLDGHRRLKADEVPVIRRFFLGGGTGTDTIRQGGSSSPGAEDRLKAARRRSGGAEQEIPLFSLQSDGRFYLEPPVAGEYRPAIPQLVKVSGAFAMIIPDDRLEPRFGAGEIIYVNPNRPATPGSYAVVRLKEPTGAVIIGRVISADSDGIQLRCADLCNRTQRPGEGEWVKRHHIGQLGIVVAIAMN